MVAAKFTLWKGHIQSAYSINALYTISQSPSSCQLAGSDASNWHHSSFDVNKTTLHIYQRCKIQSPLHTNNPRASNEILKMKATTRARLFCRSFIYGTCTIKIKMDNPFGFGFNLFNVSSLFFHSRFIKVCWRLLRTVITALWHHSLPGLPRAVCS